LKFENNNHYAFHRAHFGNLLLLSFVECLLLYFTNLAKGK